MTIKESMKLFDEQVLEVQKKYATGQLSYLEAKYAIFGLSLEQLSRNLMIGGMSQQEAYREAYDVQMSYMI